MGLPDRLLEHVDFTKPGVYQFFLAVLVLLPYWYFHEGAEVQREFARLYREIAKEGKLLEAMKDSWKTRFESAIAFFDMGVWFVAAWTALLLLACGLVFLHGAQSDNIERVFAVASDAARLAEIEAELKLRLAPEHFERCHFLDSGKLPAALRGLALSNKATEAGLLKNDSGLALPQRIEKMAHEFGIEFSAGVPLPDANSTGLKIDYVLEREVEAVFRERTACQVCDSASIAADVEKVVACINSGWRHRKAQRLIGSGYLIFCVIAVLYMKRMKSFAFSEMQEFGVVALDGASAPAAHPLSPPAAPPPIVPSPKPAHSKHRKKHRKP